MRYWRRGGSADEGEAPSVGEEDPEEDEEVET